MAAAIGFTLASFTALGLYDALGCAVVVPGRIRLTTAWFAGAAGNAISNTLGFHAVTGTAVRLRIYRRAGIELGDALRIISLSWMGIGLGVVGLVFLAGFMEAGLGRSSAVPTWPTSVGLGVALTAFLVWLSDKGRSLRLGKWRLELPSTRSGMALVVLGILENGAAIAALYVLLPAASAPLFLPFALSYVGAVALGVVSQVPGGLGIFEATLLSIWAGRADSGWAIAFIVYRLVYNLLPFALSVIGWATWELANAAKGRASPQFDGG